MKKVLKERGSDVLDQMCEEANQEDNWDLSTGFSHMSIIGSTSSFDAKNGAKPDRLAWEKINKSKRQRRGVRDAAVAAGDDDKNSLRSFDAQRSREMGQHLEREMGSKEDDFDFSSMGTYQQAECW